MALTDETLWKLSVHIPIRLLQQTDGNLTVFITYIDFFFSYESNFSFTGLDSVKLRSTLVLLHGKCLVFNELPT